MPTSPVPGLISLYAKHQYHITTYAHTIAVTIASTTRCCVSPLRAPCRCSQLPGRRPIQLRPVSDRWLRQQRSWAKLLWWFMVLGLFV